MPGQLRLFVACELPDDVRRALGDVQDGLRSHLESAARLRWVRPEGVHVTLKFLGGVEESRVAAIRGALSNAIEPFRLEVRPAHVGGFPSTSLRAGSGARLRVIWVGLEGDVEGLSALAGRIDGALEPLGFAREQRAFAAHLTLARVPEEVSPTDRRRLSELLPGYQPAPLPSMTLTEVALMQSTLRPGGAVYQKIASFPAAGS